MILRLAEKGDGPLLGQLAAALWPRHTAAQMQADMEALLLREDAALFIGFEGQEAVGFALCQLRRDYVEGASTSPVGYLEGVYVRPACQRRGYGRALVAACQDWAKGKGCREFASDCEGDNAVSIAFHGKAGFATAARIVCFIKPLT